MLLESGHLLESTEEILSNYRDLDIRTVKSYTMEVGPGHPWYFQKPCHVDFKDKQVIEGGTQWLCSAPIATTGRCSSLPYIRFVVNVDGTEAANH